MCYVTMTSTTLRLAILMNSDADSIMFLGLTEDLKKKYMGNPAVLVSVLHEDRTSKVCI